MTISFAVPREALGDAIARAAQGLPSRPVQPVYAGMLFRVSTLMRAVEITCSDGEVTFVSTVRDADIADGNGSFILPGKVIADIFRYLPAGKEVTVEYQGDGTAAVTASRARYAFRALDGSEYPQWLPPGKYLGTVDGAEFAAAVRSVVPAASRLDSRPSLRTVALSLADDRLTMVATDSYRMAQAVPRTWSALDREEGGEAPLPQVLVPGWVMERFARSCDAEAAIGWSGGTVTLGSGNLQVTARQVAGDYLDWPKVIAKYALAGLGATANAADMTRAVRAAQLIAGSDASIICEFGGDGHIHIRATGGDADGGEMIGTDYRGDTVTFLIGPQMLLDGLAGCGAEAAFSFSADLLAPVFLDGGKGFRYFMQPRSQVAGG